jgi:hypothetical protein
MLYTISRFTVYSKSGIQKNLCLLRKFRLPTYFIGYRLVLYTG